jgi:hypothetical protein
VCSVASAVARRHLPGVRMATSLSDDATVGSRSVTKDVKALFTGDAHADLYARYRPSYPPALYAAIAEYAGAGVGGPSSTAVDIATGTGQAAQDLSSRFGRVLALDASAAQVPGG